MRHVALRRHGPEAQRAGQPATTPPKVSCDLFTNNRDGLVTDNTGIKEQLQIQMSVMM